MARNMGHIDLRTGPLIRANSSLRRNMVKELKFGPMGLYTKVLGETEKPTVKED